MDHRIHPRVTVDRHVTCESDGACVAVFMYDLSLGGGMFEADDMVLPVGREITVTLASSLHPAVIMWVIGKCFGARFDQELHPAIVEHHGFKLSNIGFEAMAPRDRFGRLLPPLAKVCI